MGKASRGKKQRWTNLIEEHGSAEASKIRNESRLARRRNNLLKSGTSQVWRRVKDKDGVTKVEYFDRFSPAAKKFLGL